METTLPENTSIQQLLYKIKSRLELDREIKERRNEIQRLERRLVQKEEALDRKVESLEQKKNFLIKRRKRFRNFMNRH